MNICVLSVFHCWLVSLTIFETLQMFPLLCELHLFWITCLLNKESRRHLDSASLRSSSKIPIWCDEEMAADFFWINQMLTNDKITSSWPSHLSIMIPYVPIIPQKTDNLVYANCKPSTRTTKICHRYVWYSVLFSIGFNSFLCLLYTDSMSEYE